MSVLALVRHGETAANARGMLLGREDPPLTERGRQQASSLGSALAREAPRAIVSSPLVRAVETATAIAASCGGLAVEIDERLIELDYGEWDGLTFPELPDGAVSRWQADRDFAPPGGESLVAVRARVTPCAEELLARDGPVVAVSHVSPIKAAVVWALAVDDAATWRMYLGIASITRVAMRADRPVLTTFGDTAHLT